MNNNSWPIAIGIVALVVLVLVLIMQGYGFSQIPTPFGPLQLTTPESGTANTGTTNTTSSAANGQPRAVLPRCDCEVSVRSNEPLVLRVRWGASTRELAEDGANKVHYSASIDGRSVADLEAHRQPAVFIKNSYQGDDAWWVHWDYPVGTLSTGEHVLAAKFTAAEDVFDGWETTRKDETSNYEAAVFVNQ